MILEISVYNLQDAIDAEKAGADRLEICDNYSMGGITANFEVLQKIAEKINIPVFPIIRPRAGNFVYTNNEFEQMCDDVLRCKQLGFKGIVTGILKEDNTIDIERTKQIIEIAHPLAVTFHKAFDVVENSTQAIQQLINIGCKRVLTSGKQRTAIEGKPLLQALHQEFSNEITIVVAGSIRSNNLSKLLSNTYFTEIHSAALQNSNDEILFDADEIKKMKQIMLLHP